MAHMGSTASAAMKIVREHAGQDARILVAAEVGERVLGWPSRTSKPVLGIVYARPTKEYLRVERQPDTFATTERVTGARIDALGPYEMAQALDASRVEAFACLSSPETVEADMGALTELRRTAMMLFSPKDFARNVDNIASGILRTMNARIDEPTVTDTLALAHAAAGLHHVVMRRLPSPLTIRALIEAGDIPSDVAVHVDALASDRMFAATESSAGRHARPIVEWAESTITTDSSMIDSLPDRRGKNPKEAMDAIISKMILG